MTKNSTLGNGNNNNALNQSETIIVTNNFSLINFGGLLGNSKNFFKKNMRRVKRVKEIFSNAESKVININDNNSANQRVVADILQNGSYTETDATKEYYGGIIAESRSLDGKDDSMIPYSKLISELTTNDLLLHYILYRSLNKLLLEEKSRSINIFASNELNSINIYLCSPQWHVSIPNNRLINYGRLFNKGLILSYEENIKKIPNTDKHTQIFNFTPTQFGIELYCVAYNKLKEIHTFINADFGDLKELETTGFVFASNEKELFIKINEKVIAGI